MAHEIDLSNDRENIAYVGDKPWHGLGQELTADADIDTWKIEAGLGFTLMEYPALYINPMLNGGDLCSVPDRKVLVRDDTQVPLATVSDRYQVVQPGEVLEFYRDIVTQAGFTLEAAGALAGGRKYWATAKLGMDARIMGQDSITGYLLLATACDGSLATTAMFTSIRTICANTLRFAVQEGESGNARQYIKVPHSRTFDPEAVKAELGLAATSWDSFIERSTHLAKRQVSHQEAVEFLVKVLGDDSKPVEEQENARVIKRVFELYQGGGKGSDLRSAKDTAWGLVNAVTEFQDHHRNARTADSRLDRSWFGDGALIKQRAWDAAVDLLAA